MSTVEIAELTGKRHDNVLRDTEAMLSELKKSLLRFEASYLAGNGKYERMLRLPKLECLTLITGYSVELRHRINARWLELEEKVAAPRIDLSDPRAMRAPLRPEMDRADALESAADKSGMIAYVVSKNMMRPMLDEGQRGMVAARLAKMPQGARTDLSTIVLMSQPQAAALLNVSVGTVKRARVVTEHAVPELVAAVEQGKVSVSAAAKATKRPKAEQVALANGEARPPANTKPRKVSEDTKRQVSNFHSELIEFVQEFGPRLLSWVKAHPELDEGAMVSILNALDTGQEELRNYSRDIESILENRK